MILSVDTTHEFGSLALTGDGALVEEVLLHSPDGFGHVLFGHIGSLLDRHHCGLAAIDCFAAASGPGSFTGVRIGLACVKGLAEATGKPVVGVSNLEAIATFGSHPLRAAVLDARRGEVYGAVYDSAGRIVCGEVVAKFPAWLATLSDGVEFVSTLKANGTLASRDANLAILILENLVQNAIQATPPNCVVKLHIEAATDCWICSVVDQGPGLPPERREALFSPGHSTKPGGSGLGLAISKQLAKQIGAELELKSSTNGGCVFTLSLPQKSSLLPNELAS